MLYIQIVSLTIITNIIIITYKTKLRSNLRTYYFFLLNVIIDGDILKLLQKEI